MLEADYLLSLKILRNNYRSLGVLKKDLMSNKISALEAISRIEMM